MNNYHIYEAVGRGKHSVVYKGRKKHTIMYYAIKSVDKDQKPRVQQEVKAMHVLDSPQVLKFFAWYETTNHLWLILEYCVGGSLQTLLKQDISLPESSIHDFGRDLVTSLAYLHSKGFIYCDLKPSNVLLDENGRLKLGGFGLSRKLSEISRQALAGQPLPTAKHGTPVYMAPELFMEGALHSSRSDVWSLGCVLYEMASGRPPFVAPTLTQLVSDILNVEHAPLQGCTPEFQDLVNMMLDKNPATRAGWKEIAAHPFWHAQITIPDNLPPEPALEAFIARHHLAPSHPSSDDAVRQSRMAAANARSSVDVFRISQIASRNVEKEQEGEGDANGEYGSRRVGHRGTEARARTQAGDVALDNTDAELDFEERQESAAEDEEGGSSRANSQPEGEGRAQGLARSASSSGASMPASGMPAGGDGAGEQRLHTAPADTARSKDSAASVTAAGPAPARTDSAHLVRADSGGLAQAEAASTSGQRLASPAPSEARPSATPQLGSNPRHEKREPRGDMQGAESAAESAGVRGGIESMGARHGHVVLEDVVWHPSDMLVKPIVGNRRIERVPEPRWDSGSLPFKPLGLQDLLLAPQTALEQFLQQIYVALSSSSAMTDKINILSYFETLCGDPGAANVLINSTLMSLFVRMLKSVRHERLRVRLCAVIGKLLRHATYIADELASTGLMDALAEALKDPSERVRRRAMGALGELLFFCATQQHDEGAREGGEGEGEGKAGSCWEVPGTVFSQISRVLRQGEDEVTQHYALKAVENIASQGGDWGSRFATQEAAFQVAQIMASTKTDSLRGTAASTLCRLCRVQPSLLPFVVDKCGVKLFVSALSDTSNKSQGASATILSLAVGNDGLQARVRAQLMEDKQLVAGILHLLSSPLHVLQAKAVLLVGFLCRQSLGFLTRLGQKAFDRFERLSREREPYLRATLVAFRNEIAAQLPLFLAQVSDDLGTLSKRRFTSGGSQRALTPGQMKAPLHHMGVLPPLLLSPVTRSTVISSPLLSSVASFIAVLASPGVSFAGLPEFREALVQTLAALQEHAGVLAGQQRAGGGEEGMGEREEREAGEEGGEGVAGAGAEFVGALCDVVGSRDADSELRFACVSLLTDVVLTHLGAGADGGGAAGAGPLDAAIERYVLPLLPSLLEDRGSEMMPLNALKTIVALLECGPHWVPGVVALGLTPRFFSYLSLDSPNNNVHNMRICRALVIGGAVPLSKVASLEVVPRVMSVLSYAFDNSVEPFLEPVLDLCCSLLERDQHAAHEGIPGAGVTGPLVDALPVVVDLLRHPDVGVGSIAAEALSFLCEVHPGACGRMLLSREIGGALLDCLAADGAFSVPPAVQQGVLKALSALEPMEDAPSVDSNTVVALIESAVALAAQEGRLAADAEHAAMALQSVMDGC